MFLNSPGYYSRLKRNWKQYLCKILGRKYGALWEMLKWGIDHFHRDHNAPCSPPAKKRLHNHCFQFLMGIIDIPREIKDNCYAKFRGGGGGGRGFGYKKRVLVYLKIMNIWFLSKCVLFLVTFTNVMVFPFRREHY